MPSAVPDTTAAAPAKGHLHLAALVDSEVEMLHGVGAFLGVVVEEHGEVGATDG